MTETGETGETAKPHRTVADPFLNKNVQVSDDLCDRLRGRYAIGPTMENGEPEFGWREFETPPIQHEAADAIEALRAALDHIPDAGKKVRVKPLVWSVTSYGKPEVITIVGAYRINEAFSGGWAVSVGGLRGRTLKTADGRGNFANIEAAKAAAQADYEARILSTLDAQAGTAGAVEEPAGWMVHNEMVLRNVNSVGPPMKGPWFYPPEREAHAKQFARTMHAECVPVFEALARPAGAGTDGWVADRQTLFEAAMDSSLSDGAVRALCIAREGEITDEAKAWAISALATAQAGGAK